MMKLHLVVFFTTCFLLCCIFVTSDTQFRPTRDQVEILLALKNEFPSFNCEPMWNTFDISLLSPNISSWTEDADLFDGVSFDEETGAVTSLNLQGACLSGTIMANSSLFRFKHLKYLSLSVNHIDSSPIAVEFGSFTNLETLDLSRNGFIGEVPSSIRNLSRLTYLDLSYNKLTGPFPQVQNLHLLSSISLSYNRFSGTIPSSLFTMPSLQYLYSRQNYLEDPLENMESSSKSKLKYLDMAKNRLSCRILEPISKLASLSYLDLSFQNFTTTYTIDFGFLPFKSLEQLDLSGNNVPRLDIGSTHLSQLTLSSCDITEFPKFINNLGSLENLDISKNRIEGKVPEWLWNQPSLLSVNLSHNSFDILEGSLKVLLNTSLSVLDLSSNTIQGSFPDIPPTIKVMVASNNNFTGDIRFTFCNASYLSLLDLSNNNIGGSIPRCLKAIRVLKLRNNNFIGTLPDIQVSDFALLDVGHNQISGNLPRSLINCTSLEFLNVEDNRIVGNFPFWLKDLPSLKVIVLRSNRFHGPISSPKNPLSFPLLRIIDISRNNFNGSLPPNYFMNWSSPLVEKSQSDSGWPDYTGYWHIDYAIGTRWYFPSIDLRYKGRNIELAKIPERLTSIDFSGNRFEGKIPESVGLLELLIVLDLSNNCFKGCIPSSLAKLTQLESLDLSQNQLFGIIPQELGVLTFLSYINISDNKLTGRIPQSSQIGGQPISCFQGNIDLCGLPLLETCFNNRGGPPPHTQEEQEQVLNWKAAAIGYGPGVLFGLAIGQALAYYKPTLIYKLFRI